MHGLDQYGEDSETDSVVRSGLALFPSHLQKFEMIARTRSKGGWGPLALDDIHDIDV
jgi:hypothetical protein